MERFSSVETEELLQRLLLKELSDEAKAAIVEILESRGIVGHTYELQARDAMKAVFRRSGVTNQCDFCGRTVVLLAISDSGQRFCGESCRENARLAEASIGLAPDLIVEHARSIRVRPCPVCCRSGSVVEMRKAHYVISLVWLIHTESSHALSCKRCGVARNMKAAALCLLMGWWSIWGLILTPVRIYQNIRLAMRKDEAPEPSAELIKHAMMDLASSLRSAGVLGEMEFSRGA